VGFHPPTVRLESLTGGGRVGDVIHNLIGGKLGEQGQGGNEVGVIVNVREGKSFQFLQQNAEGIGMLYEQLELVQLGAKSQPLFAEVIGIKLTMLGQHGTDYLAGGEVKEVIAALLEEKALVYANAFQEDSDEGLFCTCLRVPILPEEIVERADRCRVRGGGGGWLSVKGSGSNSECREIRVDIFIIIRHWCRN
jgi:hypothetical protein